MHERLSLLLLCAGLVGAPAWMTPARAAERPGLGETLGKVQSGAESRAVEDLIDKLKGGSRKPPAQAPPAAASAPASAPPPAPEGTPGSPAAAPPPAPPSGEPDKAGDRTALLAAPSIDLEVLFPYKSEAITPEVAAGLAPLGRALSDARLARDSFLIAGHTDAKGSAGYNLSLSQRRAEAVRAHLITTFGLDGSRLVARGMGAGELKFPDRPFDAENRRVQIVNLSKSPLRRPAPDRRAPRPRPPGSSGPPRT
jgi:outer membrane protein OmpA-like peptidoglycan-associated protein